MINGVNLKSIIKSEKLYEKLAILLVCLYMIGGLVNVSMLGWDIVKDLYDSFLPIVAGLVLVARTYFRDKTNKKALIIALVIFISIYALLFVLPYDYNKFLLPVLLACALYNSNYAKVLRAITAVGILGITVIILLSRTGFSTDLVYYITGHVRLAFGTVYPTDFAAFIFYMIVAVIAFDKNIPKYVWAVVCFGLAGMLIFFCNARCSAICLGIAGIGCIFYYVYSIVNTKGNGNAIAIIEVLQKIIIVIETGLFSVLAILSVVLPALYGYHTRWIEKINDILNTRIILGYNALVKYGLGAFGNSDFVQNGFGGTTDTQMAYNFLDSSYMFVAIRFGLVFLVLLCAQNIFIIKKAHKSKNWMMAMSLSVIVLHSFIEHHYVEPWYNVFLLTFMCDFNIEDNKFSDRFVSKLKIAFSDKSNFTKEKKIVFILACILYLVICLGELFFLPKQMAWIRSISVAKDLKGDIILQIVVISGILLVIGFFVCGFRQLYRFESAGKRLLIIDIAGAMAIIVSSVFLMIGARGYSEFYSDNVLSDKRVIADIRETVTDSKIYIDSSEIYYDGVINDISESFLYDEELAVIRDVTYLCDADYERYVMTCAGFKMVAYENNRMLYTNSDRVINALSNKGYNVSSVYPVITSIVDYDSSEIISGVDAGNNRVVSYGPYKLCNSTYEINMEIEYAYTCADTEAVIFYLYEIYPQKEYTHKVYVSDIIDGEYSLPFKALASEEVYFRIEAGDNVECAINSMKLYRVEE